MHRIAIILACFFIALQSGSQPVSARGKYPFVHYTPKDGLVNSRVKKAYQDSKGRMYFLTYGGLSVFDGARFKNYTKNDGLVTDVVNDILEVGDDSLLVATNTDHNLNTLVRGKIGILRIQGARCGTVNQFYRHDDGRLYLSCDDGLFLLENKKVEALNISPLSKVNPLLPYLGNITGNGNLLVLTTHELRGNKGLYLFDIKNNRVIDAKPDSEFHLLGKDGSNHIWIATSGKLFILDSTSFAKGKLVLVTPPAGYERLKDYSTINVVFGKNLIWLLYRDQSFQNKEIHRLEERGNLSKIPLPEQVAVSDIKNFIVDMENTIWLCNDGDGIFKIVNAPMEIFENPFGASATNRSNNAFYSNDITWHSTGTNKIFRRSEKELEEVNGNLAQAPYIFYSNGNELLAWGARNVYQGAYDEKNRSIRFNTLFSLPDSDLFGKVIRDPYGAIISAQKSGLTVWENKKMIDHKPINTADAIQEIVFDKNNLLWVIRRYTGIDVFSLHPGNQSNYLQPVYHFAKEKTIGSPRCFLLDKNGLAWIGTRENGVIAYKQEGDQLNKLFQFDAGSGLTDNFVTTIACDSFNNIIVGTQTGLDRLVFNQRSYRPENLGKSSNFFALIVQAWADANHAFAFTNTGTLLRLSPAQRANNNNAPQLLLEEIKVNAQTVSLGKQKFRSRENNISFFVAAPSFLDEKQVAFSYLLEGSGNKKWSDTTAANSLINLTNLSPGKYTLKAKAYFPSTTYSPSEFSYFFEVTPPWWQTWWFRTIAGLLIIGMFIIGFRFYYSRKLEKQKLVLEKQQAIEKERTRIATDMHDDIGSGLSRIKFLSQSMLHKHIKDEIIKPDLEKITGYSDEMSEKMGEIIWALNEKNDTIADLVAYTRSYTSEYLLQHEIECEAHTPLHLPGTFIHGEMRRNIFLSVKECLHNIVKHAGATKVVFSVELNGGMQIVIHDNGKGIDWDMQRPPDSYRGSNGIQNIRKRMKEINGEVVFSNEQGTKVLMTIPVV